MFYFRPSRNLMTDSSERSHDWGTQLAYEAARERPDVFTAVVGISLIYLPAAGPFVPVSSLVEEFPHLGYQVYFEEDTSAAITELNADIRRTLRSTLRTASSPPPADFLLSTSSYLTAWENVTTVSLRVLGPYCIRSTSFPRSHQYRFSVRVRKITGSTNIASKISATVCIYYPHISLTHCSINFIRS